MKRGHEWKLEGQWMTANQALNATRGDGVAQGIRDALGRSERLYENFARAARGVKRAVVDLARGSRPIGPGFEQVWLVVHAKYPDGRVDPDAAAIVSKWILDGLKDSGVIASEKQVIGTMHRTTVGAEPEIYFSLQYPEEIIV